MATKPIAARLTDEEQAVLQALADAHGVSRSDYHRTLLARAIQEELRDLPTTNPERYARFAAALAQAGHRD